MRRLSDRARLEGMLALRKALETVRRGQPDPPALSLAPEPEADDGKWWQPPEPSEAERALAALPDAPLDTRIDTKSIGVAAALDRIADSIEGIAAQLDSYHVERAQHLDAIEFLLREMVISTVQPTGASAVVLGGVVAPLDADIDDDISIIPDGTPLAVDSIVEVRSRFHDRWISGFTIAEVVDEPGRLRYRLMRRSDGIPLPILFDACDVRGATGLDRTPPLSRSDTRTRT